MRNNVYEEFEDPDDSRSRLERALDELQRLVDKYRKELDEKPDKRSDD